MTWLKLFSLLLSGVQLFASYLREKQLLNAGEAIALTKSLEENSELVAKAIAARKSITPASVSNDPDNRNKQ